MFFYLLMFVLGYAYGLCVRLLGEKYDQDDRGKNDAYSWKNFFRVWLFEFCAAWFICPLAWAWVILDSVKTRINKK